MSPTVPTSKKKTKVSTATSTRRERRRQVQKSDSQRTTEGEPTEQNGAAVSWGTRIRARLGPSGARSVLMAVRAGLMFGLRHFPRQRMLTPTTADNQNIHSVYLKIAFGVFASNSKQSREQAGRCKAPGASTSAVA